MKVDKYDYGEEEFRKFKCPGCGDQHMIRVKGDKSKGPVWGYNWNDEKPTFTPSLLIRSGHYVPGYESQKCWCTYKKEHPEKNCPECYICHSFVREGKIQFLNDCTHKLAGQTVELPNIE